MKNKKGKKNIKNKNKELEKALGRNSIFGQTFWTKFRNRFIYIAISTRKPACELQNSTSIFLLAFKVSYQCLFPCFPPLYNLANHWDEKFIWRSSYRGIVRHHQSSVWGWLAANVRVAAQVDKRHCIGFAHQRATSKLKWQKNLGKLHNWLVWIDCNCRQQSLGTISSRKMFDLFFYI